MTQSRILLRRLLTFLAFQALSLAVGAQLAPAKCVASSGMQYLLDAYLASLGACNCQRAPLYLTDLRCSEGAWEIVFSDEFDGKTLDTSKWRNVPFGEGALEGAQRLDVSSLNNVTVSDGACHITAKREPLSVRAVSWKNDSDILEDGKINLRHYDYSSAIIFSRNKFFKGKYEIRCRMPSAQGLWPAFWLFGGVTYNEIDIFDNYAGLETLVTSVGHGEHGGRVDACNKDIKVPAMNEWHTYSCEWEDDRIVFSMDERPLRILNRVATVAGQPVDCGEADGEGTYFQMKAFPIEPMNIVFNLVVISDDGPGGSVPVSPATPFPAFFDVDYIRFSKRVQPSTKVYPNPARNIIRIESTQPFESVELLDILGNVVLTRVERTQAATFDLSFLPESIYNLSIRYPGYVQHAKVIRTNG